jgi:hypothetical protein
MMMLQVGFEGKQEYTDFMEEDAEASPVKTIEDDISEGT